MRLKVFQSNTGDCLLLSSGSNHILIDGGFKSTFKDNTRNVLGEIHEKGEQLDLVCVSHIDSDHISGILQLMDDVLAWRVFDFQRAQGNVRFKEPAFPRPPGIAEIWHNGFETQVGDISSGFEATLTMQIQASVLGGNLVLAEAGRNLINGEKQAIELAHLVDPHLLNIPLNLPADGNPLVVTAEDPKKYDVGDVCLYLLGPFQEDLEQLHKEWKIWLMANHRKIASIREKAEENARRLGLSQEAALAQTLQILANELGDRTEVSTPNLASITFLAEEGNHRILMTGDAHADDIMKGLRLHEFLPEEGGTLHLDIMKIQHHGASANIHETFCKTVTADHYVFCGNGGHHNPELEVVELIVNSRLDANENAAVENQPVTPFSLWFNSSEADAGTEKRSEHMKNLQEKVIALVMGREDVVQFKFLDGESEFEIVLSD